MKRNNIFPIAVMMAMLMASVNVYGQGRSHARGAGRSGRAAREMSVCHQAPMPGRTAMPVMQHPAPVHHAAPMPVPPRVDAYGYVPGWDGRVRYLDGRWGYLRDDCWYWYDTYFAPDFYFANPLSCFHAHFHGRNAAAAVGGVAAGIAVGALINALMH